MFGVPFEFMAPLMGVLVLTYALICILGNMTIQVSMFYLININIEQTFETPWEHPIEFCRHRVPVSSACVWNSHTLRLIIEENITA